MGGKERDGRRRGRKEGAPVCIFKFALEQPIRPEVEIRPFLACAMKICNITLTYGRNFRVLEEIGVQDWSE